MKVQQAFTDLTLSSLTPLDVVEARKLMQEAKKDNQGWNCCSSDTIRGSEALQKIVDENPDQFTPAAQKELCKWFSTQKLQPKIQK